MGAVGIVLSRYNLEVSGTLNYVAYPKGNYTFLDDVSRNELTAYSTVYVKWKDGSKAYITRSTYD